MYNYMYMYTHVMYYICHFFSPCSSSYKQVHSFLFVFVFVFYALEELEDFNDFNDDNKVAVPSSSHLSSSDRHARLSRAQPVVGHVEQV